MKINTLDRIEGILLGTAVGDSLGLPMECMKPATIVRLGWSKVWKHRFVINRGMWSDDTEHSIMLAQSLLAAKGDVDTFRNKFAWELRWWLLGLPSGVGMATAKAMIKLWVGFSPKKSGVFSAGNGSCMRAAIIAAYFQDDIAKRIEFTEAQTKISHSDPKATIAATAVTEVTALFLQSETTPSASEIIELTKQADQNQTCSDWVQITQAIQLAVESKTPCSEFLTTIGINPSKGISGYAYHTVPVIIYSGIRHDWNFENVVTEIIAAGGDTDTTAAIAGALCGALNGASTIPHEWVAGIEEWPTGIDKLKVLAKAIQTKTPLRIRPYWSPLLLFRNTLFFLIVLRHGFTRLLPDCVRAKFS